MTWSRHRWWPPLGAGALSLLAALAAPPATASTLTIQSQVTHTGGWAARVDVASACGTATRTIPDGTDYAGIASEEACVELTAGDVDVLAGADVTFRAGESVVLGSGFSVASTAAFRAVAGPEVAGAAFVGLDHPEPFAQYWARFYLRPDDLALDATGFVVFAGYDAAGRQVLEIGLKRNVALAENRLFVRALETGGGTVTSEGSEELAVADGWRRVELRWQAGTGDGLVEACVDDSPAGGAGCAELDALDLAPLDAVRWGALEVPDGSFGTLYLDDFRAQEAGPVGACDTEQECP